MLSQAPVGIFISYHKKDEILCDDLKKHLAALQRNNIITIWDKNSISPGQEIENKIDENLRNSKIILLLISPDFIKDLPLEATRATELQAEQKALAIPVLLRPALWDLPPFDLLSPLPSNRKFITSDKSKQDEAFFKVVNEIKDEVNTLNDKSKYSSKEEILLAASRRNRVTKLINEADRLFKEEKLEAAAQKYQEALDIDLTSVRANISFGNVLKEQNKYKQAIDKYRTAISLNPDNAEAHFSLSFVLCEQMKLEEAMKELHKAIRLNPKFSLAYILLAVILLKQGKSEEACLKLKKSAHFASRDDRLTHNLMKRMSDKDKAAFQGLWAIILYKENRLEETIEQCKQAINFLKLQKRDSETIKLLASFHFWLGKAIQDQSKLEEASAEYHQALLFDANHVEAHYNLGAILSKQGKYKEAILEFRDVIRLDPTDADAHNKLGMALYNQGKFEEAIVEYRQALHFNPNHANAHNNFGLALGEKGKLEEAIKELNLAISLEPNNMIFAENLKILMVKEKGFWGRLFS
ncbi:tetratricopeptide repeat protein [Anabaena sp. CCY 9402-a]|uniref:tetratricopeptide repeat protein n=1 Tax=Anabaena sp. CCY 9402-a TaxID=3103867 RepID=UPI0039C5F0AA